ELGRRFALTEVELEILVDRYVIPLADFPMLSHALALESAANDGLGAAVGEVWSDVRKRVHEPIRQRPDLHALVQIGFSPWDVDIRDSASTAAHDDAGDGDQAEAVEPNADQADAAPDVEELVPLAPVDSEPNLGPHSTARSGLPSHRGGAGHVGGYTRDDPMFGAGDVELDEGGAEHDGELVDDRVGVRQVVNPVVSLFEQLRHLTPPDGEAPPLGEPEPEPAPLSEPAE